MYNVLMRNYHRERQRLLMKIRLVNLKRESYNYLLIKLEKIRLRKIMFMRDYSINLKSCRIGLDRLNHLLKD